MRGCCWTGPQKRLRCLKPPPPQLLLVRFAFRNGRQGRPIARARLFPLIPRVTRQETVVTDWNTGNSTETSENPFHIGVIEPQHRFPQGMQSNSWSHWSGWPHCEQGIGVDRWLCWGAFLPQCAVGLCAWDLMACPVLLETWLGVGVKSQLKCKVWNMTDMLLISASSRNRGWVLVSVSVWRRLICQNCMSHLWITYKTWIYFQDSGKLFSRNWLVNMLTYLAANHMTSDTVNLTCYTVS